MFVWRQGMHTHHVLKQRTNKIILYHIGLYLQTLMLETGDSSVDHFGFMLGKVRTTGSSKHPCWNLLSKECRGLRRYPLGCDLDQTDLLAVHGCLGRWSKLISSLPGIKTVPVRSLLHWRWVNLALQKTYTMREISSGMVAARCWVRCRPPCSGAILAHF